MKSPNILRQPANSVTGIRSFFSTTLRLFSGALKSKTSLLLLIVGLDLVSAASRIVVVLLIAFAVKLLSSETSFSYFGVQFEIGNSLETIFVFGALIGISSLCGAITGFNSVRLSRRLGRWSNELAMNKMFEMLSQAPSKFSNVKLNVPSNLNVLLTQVPIHTGLATETLARLINPVLLLLFAAMVLLYQQPLFAGVVFLLAMLFIPVFLRTSKNIRSNAKEFYSDRALALGRGVGKLTTLMNSQHGIAPKKELNDARESVPLAGSSFARKFFDSYDTNLLGNERIILIVSFADALLRPVLFVVLALMVFVGEFSIEATIAFLGSLAYMLTSARSVSGLLINLLRFHPQVLHFHNFVDAFSNDAGIEIPNSKEFPKTIKVPLKTEGEKTSSTFVEFCPGNLCLVLNEKKLATVNLPHILSPILGAAGQKPHILKNLTFVSSSFRFSETPIMSQLCAGERTKKREAEAKEYCEELKATASILELPDGFETQLNDSNWNNLDAQARVALRLVPLLLNNDPRIILIDIGVLRGIGEKVDPILSSGFPNSIVFLMLQDEGNCPSYTVDHYLRISSDDQLLSGDAKWFTDQMEIKRKSSDSSGGSDGSEYLL